MGGGGGGDGGGGGGDRVFVVLKVGKGCSLVVIKTNRARGV